MCKTTPLKIECIQTSIVMLTAGWNFLAIDYSNLQLIQKTVNKTSTSNIENNVKLTTIIFICDKFNALCLKKQEKCK